MKVIKRDGRAVEYNSEKICIAIEKANKEVTEEKRATNEEIEKIVKYIETLDKKRILVEDIQDIIEQKLMELGKYDLAKKYIVYRYTRALVRKQNTTDESILGLIKNINNMVDSEKETPMIASVQRNLIAGEVSKDLTKRILLPEKINKAHEEGILYFHATEYFLQPIIDSCLVNIEDMLDNGTCIRGQEIHQPEDFIMACFILTQIITNVANGQYGKQYINIKYLGKYLGKSYEKINLELSEIKESEQIEKFIENRLKSEIEEGIQFINYEINGLITIYEKTPIITLILELDDEDEYYEENAVIIKEILRQRAQLLEKTAKKENSLPKLICNFKGNNQEIMSTLMELAKKCNCVINQKNTEKYQYEGYFSQGTVSINLPQISLEVGDNINEFWNILDERLEICYEALMCRHYALLGTISDVSPIHWQNGAIARLKKGEKIDKLLKDGYSALSLGYVGLNCAVQLLGAKFDWNNNDKEIFMNKILKYLEDRTQKWRKMTGIRFIVERIVDTSANFRLYKIDKNIYGKTLDLLDYDFYKD